MQRWPGGCTRSELDEDQRVRGQRRDCSNQLQIPTAAVSALLILEKANWLFRAKIKGASEGAVARLLFGD
jgi:hypothetical protein